MQIGIAYLLWHFCKQHSVDEHVALKNWVREMRVALKNGLDPQHLHSFLPEMRLAWASEKDPKLRKDLLHILFKCTEA